MAGSLRWVWWYLTRTGWQHGEPAERPDDAVDNHPADSLFSVLTCHHATESLRPPHLNIEFMRRRRGPKVGRTDKPAK
jgi:hypothetical protein